MNRLHIRGGRPLYGAISCAGMKNAAVAILFATVLTEDRCILENVPAISDVEVALEMLRQMGAEVLWLDAETVRIDTERMRFCRISAEDSGKMRASYYLLGAQLGRFAHTAVGLPGGCNFVARPIDQHQKVFASLGVPLCTEEAYLEGKGTLFGTTIVFDKVSVGATINGLLAAVCAQGTTILQGAAKEPHVVDVAEFLIACGGRIYGAGTDTVVIEGVPQLHGCVHRIVPDMIEAGTYLIAAAATGGCVRVTDVVPSHLQALCETLQEMGATVRQGADFVEVSAENKLCGVHITTAPHPGFPTDLQPQMGVLLAISEEGGVLTEGVWDHRFQYVKELAKLGVHAEVRGKSAVFYGGDKLRGATAQAVDLRAGAALIVAGLAAVGESCITGVDHIYRGYGNICEKLASLGAEITV